MADPRWGPWGIPFEFPIFSVCSKRSFCRFLNFFLYAKYQGSYACFRPKKCSFTPTSHLLKWYCIPGLHHYLKKKFGVEQKVTNALRMQENAPFCMKISKNFRGSHPRTPSGAGRKCPAYSGLWTGNNGKCYNSRESPYFRLIFIEHTYWMGFRFRFLTENPREKPI